MTTVRDIITQALYRTGVVGLGRSAKDAEAANGLFILQGMIDGWFASGVLGALTDIRVTDDYTAKEFERVYADGATVTLPDTIDENGVVRTPKDLAVIVIDDGSTRKFVWEGAWIECTALALGDACPFAGRGKDALACLLAVNWVDTFGGQVTPYVERQARNFHALLLGNNATISTAPDYF